MATQTGDTCTGTNVSEPPKLGDCVTNQKAKDLAYFFTACPGQTALVDASTCTNPANTHFDTMVYVRPVGGNDLASPGRAGPTSSTPTFVEQPSEIRKYS